MKRQEVHNDDVLLERMDNIISKIAEIKESLKDFDDRIKITEAMINRQFVINVILGACGTSMVGIFFWILQKKIGG